MTWDLDSGLDLYRMMVSPFHNAGYLVLVYGSVLSGRPARDLDLMAVPWRPNATPPKCAFDNICSQFHLTPSLGPPYLGVMRTWNHTASDSRGRVIDFQFRRSGVTLEESFGYSMRGDRCVE